MEKNCLVTQLKSRTGNTDLPVLGFIKIKISRISELNEEAWNVFTLTSIKGKSVTVKILGEGYMYTSSEKREANTGGEKSKTFSGQTQLFFSNGDYEILIEKYTISSIASGNYGRLPLRGDSIHFDYKTFENSNLNELIIRQVYKNGKPKYPLNISGSIKSLPITITGIYIYGDEKHPVNLEDLAPFAMSLKKLLIYAKDVSNGSFDDFAFNKVMNELAIANCNFTGNVENVPISTNDINYGFNKFYGNVREPIERIAENVTAAKNVYFYIQENKDEIFWRETSFNALPKPGWLYLTLDGTGGVTVYGDEARTNLLGSFNGTTWSYPS